MSERENNHVPELSIKEQSEALRDLLYEEEGSAEMFKEVIALIVSIKNINNRQTLIDYATTHLNEWPDEVRMCEKDTQPSWKDIFLNEGKLSFLAPLFRSLNLRYNNLGPEGATALANSENLKNLTILDLWYNNLGLEGATALANSENLKNLTSLNLSSNNLGLEGATALIGLKVHKRRLFLRGVKGLHQVFFCLGKWWRLGRWNEGVFVCFVLKGHCEYLSLSSHG